MLFQLKLKAILFFKDTFPPKQNKTFQICFKTEFEEYQVDLFCPF